MKLGRAVLLALIVMALAVGLSHANYTIGLSMATFEATIYHAQVDAIQEYLDSQGAELVMVVANNDAQRQVSQIEDLLARGVDAIIATPHDKRVIVSAIREANREGVPFVTMGRAADSGAEVAYHVGADPYADGRDAAKFMAYSSIGAGISHDVLVLIGNLVDENAVGRYHGYMDEAVLWPQLNVIGEAPTEWLPERAYNAVINTLEAHPSLSAIFCPSDYLLPSVLSALTVKNALHPKDHPDHILIVSIDGDPFGWEQTKQGWIDADIATLADKMGTRAAEVALDLAKGKTFPDPVEVISGLLYTTESTEHVSELIWGSRYEK